MDLSKIILPIVAVALSLFGVACAQTGGVPDAAAAEAQLAQEGNSETLDERAQKYNERYEKLKAELQRRAGHLLTVPDVTPGVSQPVHDSIQFNLDASVTEAQVKGFLVECHAHGLPVELFGAKSNARNFVNWEFAPAEDPLPMTVGETRNPRLNPLAAVPALPAVMHFRSCRC